MTRVVQDATRSELRIGRLRLWKPASLRALSSVALDPHVSAHCANGGTETISWLLRVDATSLTTGSARPSVDGKAFSFANETLPPSVDCPGFIAATATIAPTTVALNRDGTGFLARVDRLDIAVFHAGYALPLRDVTIEVPRMTDPSCIGAWNPRYWCDADSLGWTTAGRITAKISVEDADRVPVKAAGCQSLCAILADDTSKTDAKLCKRTSDGRVAEVGDACIGGSSCKNAFDLVATFAAYGIEIR